MNDRELRFYLEDPFDHSKCLNCSKKLVDHSSQDLHDCAQAVDEACTEAELNEY